MSTFEDEDAAPDEPVADDPDAREAPGDEEEERGGAGPLGGI